MSKVIQQFGELRSRFNRLRRDAAWNLGSRSFLQKKCNRILVYHGICQDDHLQFNTLFVTLKTFEQQLKLYKRFFRIVSLDDFYEQRYDTDRPVICLSFDDGFANNYRYVLPLLEEYEVPATFFITAIREAGYDILWNDLLALARQFGPPTFYLNNQLYTKERSGSYVSASTGKLISDTLRSGDFTDKAQLYEALGYLKNYADADYWLQMTPGQIRELSLSNWVTIGSHGFFHNDLATIPGGLVTKELRESRRFLEEVTGKKVNALAFPYGSYHQGVVSIAKDLGYTRLLATEFNSPSDSEDTALRPRLTINPYISNINQLYANVTGSYK